MSDINKLLDELNILCESEENIRRLSLWRSDECGIRGETQWHGVPNYSVESTNPMPVTTECLDTIWQNALGLDLSRYFTDPDYFLEYYLKIKLRKFKDFKDDTPLTRDIPVSFGVTHEAGILGQEIFLDHGEEPSFSRQSIVDENTEFPESINFRENEYLQMVIGFYGKVKKQVGEEFNVIFPHWFRGPQGVALYIRGFEEFSVDLYMNEDLTHRILRFVTNVARDFVQWRSEYLDEPIARGDLFNDDIPIMSPEFYSKYFLPYEQELCDFYNGIYYWHSCGDITKHVPEIHRLSDITLFDFGVSMEYKGAGIEGLRAPQTLELRVFAQHHIQECSEEESKTYIRQIVEDCRKGEITRYVIRSSGMSVFLGVEKDLEKLMRWVELVREVQDEFIKSDNVTRMV
ncbi:MAG TPA: hypothetical protein ENI15_04390 [Spirochaetes bacterium]|nr:hypothetical protein [Spirochaetota bacterium]